MSIPSLIAGALGLFKRVPWQVWAAIALLFVGWQYGVRQFNAGVHAERAAEAKREAKAARELAKKQAAAATADAETRASGTAAITERRKELDNAKVNLPDQGLSARQRARACAELRRAHRSPPPGTAC